MKEAFSRDLVVMLIRGFYLGKGNSVLDPFCGVGTTLLACKELGIDCWGYDVHPLMLFVSRVKLGEYDVRELEEVSRVLLAAPFERPEVRASDFLRRFFPQHVLEDIFFFKGKIEEIGSGAIRDFLLTALVGAAMECTWARRDGAAVKVRMRKLPPLREVLSRRLSWMRDDVERLGVKRASITVKECDARRMDADDETFDAVITSPPYLGKFEYARAYRVEEEILGLEPPSPEKLLGSPKNPEEVADPELYFNDLSKVVNEMYRVCKPGADVALLASDGCFPKRGVVEVCQPLRTMAERAGFKTRRALVINRRFCTSPSRRKLGISQEYIFLLRKP